MDLLGGGCRRTRTFGGRRPQQIDRCAAGYAGRRRLVEGRSGDQRRHRGRGPPASCLPGHSGRRRPGAHGELDPVEAVRRRGLVVPLRRTLRPVPDRRGLRGAAPRRRRHRRRAHAPGGGVRARPRRAGARARVHAALVGPVRRVVVAGVARHSPRTDPPAPLDPAEHLRLRLLGASDDRSAHDREHLPAARRHRYLAGRVAHRGSTSRAPPAADQHPRRAVPALRQAAAQVLLPAPVAGPGDVHEARRAVDHPPPGVRRLLGRYPTAVGVLDHRPAPARLPAGSPRHRPGSGGLRQVRGS